MHADPILVLADFLLPVLSLAYGVSQSNIIGNNEASATAQDEGESQISSGLVQRSFLGGNRLLLAEYGTMHKRHVIVPIIRIRRG